MGYPIVEAEADGTFVVTKHAGTGGAVTVPGVTEQLVYEMGDPHSYITPDGVADFTTIRLAQDGADRVRVSGIRGREATAFLKVSVAYRAGYKAVGTLVYAWPDAVAKAREADRILRARLERLGLRFEEILTELVGANATHGPLAGAPPAEVPEVQLRVGVRSPDRAAVERFTRELAPLILNGPPGVTGFAGGRPKVEEIVAYWPRARPQGRDRSGGAGADRMTIPKLSLVGDPQQDAQVVKRARRQVTGWRLRSLLLALIAGPLLLPPADGGPRRHLRPAGAGGGADLAPHPQADGGDAGQARAPGEGAMKVRLLALAHARSGDKGDTANVGVIARRPEFYPILEREVTARGSRRTSRGCSRAGSSGSSCPISGR